MNRRDERSNRCPNKQGGDSTSPMSCQPSNHFIAPLSALPTTGDRLPTVNFRLKPKATQAAANFRLKPEAAQAAANFRLKPEPHRLLWLPPLGGRRPPALNFGRDYRRQVTSAGTTCVSARPRPSVACVKNPSQARRIRSILATTAGSAVRPLPTTNRNAWWWTFGESACVGLRGPITCDDVVDQNVSPRPVECHAHRG